MLNQFSRFSLNQLKSLVFILLTVAVYPLHGAEAAPVVQHTQITTVQPAVVQQFAKQFVQEHPQFSYHAVMQILAKAKTQEKIITLMNKPYEALPWYRYQKIYEHPSKVTYGVKFWQKNQKSFSIAARQYGVPAQVSLAILGIETNYGKTQGTYRALDALYTLSFSYPRRAKYFQSELAHFLILTHNAKFDPTTVNSSYAGALGMPQFMPSSYQKFAISNSQHYPNLFSDNEDAIDSVAHYLAQSGWVRRGPIAEPTHLNKQIHSVESLTNRNLTLEQLKAYGFQVPQKLKSSTKAQLIILEGKAGPEYYLAFKNFFVIKRYNNSNLYAMAVTELSKKLLHAWVARPQKSKK